MQVVLTKKLSSLNEIEIKRDMNQSTNIQLEVPLTRQLINYTLRGSYLLKDATSTPFQNLIAILANQVNDSRNFATRAISH